MATPTATLQIRGLGKKKIAAVAKRAKQLGMTPQAYLRHLVEADLAISDRAKNSSLAELLGPGEEVGEPEIDHLVEAARIDYHRARSRRTNGGGI